MYIHTDEDVYKAQQEYEGFIDIVEEDEWWKIYCRVCDWRMPYPGLKDMSISDMVNLLPLHISGARHMENLRHYEG